MELRLIWPGALCGARHRAAAAVAAISQWKDTLAHERMRHCESEIILILQFIITFLIILSILIFI